MLYFGLHYRSFFILLSHSFFILYSTHSLIVTILSTKFSLIAQEVPFDLLQLFYVACERAIRQLTVSTVSIYIIIFTAINHTGTPGLWVHRPTTTAAKELRNISSLYLVGASCRSLLRRRPFPGIGPARTSP